MLGDVSKKRAEGYRSMIFEIDATPIGAVGLPSGLALVALIVRPDFSGD